MKYKIGDKVRVKTWEQLEKECLTIDTYNNSCLTHISHHMDEKLRKIDRIVTIKKANSSIYEVIEMGNVVFSDPVIECLATAEVFEPIKNRWDILDIRRD